MDLSNSPVEKIKCFKCLKTILLSGTPRRACFWCEHATCTNSHHPLENLTSGISFTKILTIKITVSQYHELLVKRLKFITELKYLHNQKI